MILLMLNCMSKQQINRLSLQLDACDNRCQNGKLKIELKTKTDLEVSRQE